MRQIVLDTETTGLSPRDGHRIIEIAGVEMIDRRLTGDHYHCYINPQRPVDAGAFSVHGLDNQFLDDKPLFADIVTEFLAYVDGAELVIHNAPFDVGFINHELARHDAALGKIEKYCKIFDTLTLARKLHRGQKNNLDALCKRYEVDNSARDLHGALLDSEILAQVYLAMTIGQGALFSEDSASAKSQTGTSQSVAATATSDKPREPLVIIKANSDECTQHDAYVEMLKKEADQVVDW